MFRNGNIIVNLRKIFYKWNNLGSTLKEEWSNNYE